MDLTKKKKKKMGNSFSDRETVSAPISKARGNRWILRWAEHRLHMVGAAEKKMKNRGPG
jgi:hypothetical protein